MACAIIFAAIQFYGIAAEGFENWPSLIGVRPLVIVSIAIAAVTLIAIAIDVSGVLYKLICAAAPESVRRSLQRLRALFVFAAFYALGAFTAFWLLTGLMHPSLIGAALLIVWVSLSAAALTTVFLREIKHL